VVLYNADKRPELRKTLELYLEVIRGEYWVINTKRLAFSV
jgi:hypothetical protein